MTESECEIEYLDEDADIVQQLVQSQPTQPLEPTPEPDLVVEEKEKPLLVERPQKRKRTLKKLEESDDDYDPMEDMVPSPPSPPSPKLKKKKHIVAKKSYKPEKDSLVTDYSPMKKLNFKKVMRENRVLSGKEQYAILKKLNIKIPDFDDPLCLPVKAVDSENGGNKRLETWNNVCLEHFKHCDTILKPERGETKSSLRTVVLRNVFNKRAGRKETTVWSKTCVINEDSDKKSEIFQCVLPNYKEKKTLNINNIITKKSKSTNPTIDEVVLRKEDHKDGETLVVYKPQSGISSVFTLVDKRKQEPDDEETKPKGQEERSTDKYEEVKMYLKEVTCCRMCVHCFQESWRGLKKTQGPIVCPICSRSFVTVYSLLTHIKAHSTNDVQRFKRVISLALSEIVGYHYKCRMCREKCTSIKDMREHVATHRGSELFTCEVGNHLTR